MRRMIRRVGRLYLLFELVRFILYIYLIRGKL